LGLDVFRLGVDLRVGAFLVVFVLAVVFFFGVLVEVFRFVDVFFAVAFFEVFRFVAAFFFAGVFLAVVFFVVFFLGAGFSGSNSMANCAGFGLGAFAFALGFSAFTSAIVGASQGTVRATT
jgi:hypothetical protein